MVLTRRSTLSCSPTSHGGHVRAYSNGLAPVAVCTGASPLCVPLWLAPFGLYSVAWLFFPPLCRFSDSGRRAFAPPLPLNKASHAFSLGALQAHGLSPAQHFVDGDGAAPRPSQYSRTICLRLSRSSMLRTLPILPTLGCYLRLHLARRRGSRSPTLSPALRGIAKSLSSYLLTSSIRWEEAVGEMTSWPY